MKKLQSGDGLCEGLERFESKSSPPFLGAACGASLNSHDSKGSYNVF